MRSAAFPVPANTNTGILFLTASTALCRVPIPPSMTIEIAGTFAPCSTRNNIVIVTTHAVGYTLVISYFGYATKKATPKIKNARTIVQKNKLSVMCSSRTDSSFAQTYVCAGGVVVSAVHSYAEVVSSIPGKNDVSFVDNILLRHFQLTPL